MRTKEKASAALAEAEASMTALEQDILDLNNEIQKVAVTTANGIKSEPF